MERANIWNELLTGLAITEDSLHVTYSLMGKYSSHERLALQIVYITSSSNIEFSGHEAKIFWREMKDWDKCSFILTSSLLRLRPVEFSYIRLRQSFYSSQSNGLVLCWYLVGLSELLQYRVHCPRLHSKDWRAARGILVYDLRQESFCRSLWPEPVRFAVSDDSIMVQIWIRGNFGIFKVRKTPWRNWRFRREEGLVSRSA